jgi:hypothetical protein
VYHALALARDEFFARLIRYVDLWLMLRQAPAILEGAGRRAREWRAVRALYGTLQQAASLFPELREELARPASELLAPATRRFLERRVLPSLEERSILRPRRRGLQIWRKFWLMDNPGRRARFALQYAGALARGRWLQARSTNVSKAVDFAGVEGENTARSKPEDRWP